MVFSSLPFLLLFLPLLLLTYFLRREIAWRNAVLLVFSLLFYAWGEPVMVLVMLASTLVNYVCGCAIAKYDQPGTKRLFLAVGVVASLGMLVFFKYMGFLLENISSLTGITLAIKTPSLPIGISFYTFQLMTYTIDVYRGNVPCQRSFSRLLLYVSCFPQLIAGPIVQYGDIAAQLSRRNSGLDGFCRGGRRFFVGLGKKVLLANTCSAMLEDCVLAGGGNALSVGGAWLVAFLYSMQLYYDFSAYSDMAIGLGQVFGFTYRENFLYPYISRSPSEFWRRWHISLGSFFREYVYIPLGGNRRGRFRTMWNLFVVWALTGLWHGASWNFVAWGLYWFLLQQVDKAIPSFVQKKIPSLFRGIATFLMTLVGWVLFYYTDLGLGWTHITAMFGVAGVWLDDVTVSVFRSRALFFPLLVIGALPWIPWLKDHIHGRRWQAVTEALASIAAVLIGIVSLLFLVGQTSNPFIYFRF